MHAVNKTRTGLLRSVVLVWLVSLWAPVVVAEPHSERTPPLQIEVRRRQTPGSETLPPQGPASWRPYANPQVLVTLGMTKAEVLLKAGSPAFEETLSHGTDGHRNLTVWTYMQTGHNTSVTNLTFQGNKLVRIETALNP